MKRKSRDSLPPAIIPAFTGMTLLLFAGNAQAYDFRGHAKLQATAVDLPADSLLRDFGDDPLRDSAADLRFNLNDRAGGWSWRADYQLQAAQGDRLELQQQTSLIGYGASALPEDDLRLFDLTHRISEDDDRAITHRLDRLYLSHSSADTVFKFGRQAVSWGNGLIYNPVDFFNPFNPAAIDTEYKTGDDMIYAQHLLDSGDDLQAVWVVRRDDDEDIASQNASLAFKYHGFSDQAEFDLLAAEHYDAPTLALGGGIDVGGSIWRGDIIVTDADGETYTSAVVNWSQSWIAWGKNLSANIEYYHNGFGIDDGDYGPAALADNPELAARLHYLAAAAIIELAPLWQMTATLFKNLDDESLLLQLLSRHDLQQDLQLLVALNLPHGDDGSEFGGIDSAVPERPLAVDESLFAQLAWYF
jgi:hypothetical protein